MRVCFASDFHGNRAHYTQYLRWIADRRPQLVVLGGDNFPDGDGQDPPAAQVAFIERDFADWIGAVRAELPGVGVAAINGNHDWLPARDALRRLAEGGLLVGLDEAALVEGVTFTGFSHTPPTPWTVKDFERLDAAGDPIPAGPVRAWDGARGRGVTLPAEEHYTRQATLSELLAGDGPAERPWIFVCHAPPHDTPLDRLPAIPHPVGSRAVRAYIERTQPRVSLHGHIHESPLVAGAYHTHLGATLCVNPGQSDELFAVCFDTDDPEGTLVHSVRP